MVLPLHCQNNDPTENANSLPTAQGYWYFHMRQTVKWQHQKKNQCNITHILATNKLVWASDENETCSTTDKSIQPKMICKQSQTKTKKIMYNPHHGYSRQTWIWPTKSTHLAIECKTRLPKTLCLKSTLGCFQHIYIGLVRWNAFWCISPTNMEEDSRSFLQT